MKVRDSKNLEVVMEQGIELVEFYRNSPCIAAYDLLGVDFAPIQRVIFNDMWFKNYCITVVGRGGGKSAAIDSLAFVSEDGLCYLYEQFPEVPSFLRSGETLELEYDKKIYTSDGFKSTKKVSLEKDILGLKLTTKYGFEHKGSYHHPLLTIDENANFCYKQLQDFKLGDRICVQRGQNVFGDNSISEEDAYLIGLFIGDGLISDKYNFQNISTADEEILRFCINYCEKHNISYRVGKDKRRPPLCEVFFKQFTWFFDKYKIKRCLSYYKEVPYSIRTATREAQISFLRGYFDCDGGFDGKGVSCCSVSKKLMKEIQMMLLNLGIVSRLREKKTKSKFGKAFLLQITSHNMEIFHNIVNFGLTRKRKQIRNYLESKILNSNVDTIPYIMDICHTLYVNYKRINGGTVKSKNLPKFSRRVRNGSNFKEYTYGRLNEFLYDMHNIIGRDYKLEESDLVMLSKLKCISDTNYYFDRVESVEEWSGDCYDFEMDMGRVGTEPNYFCSGFINHNTFMLGTLAVLSCLLYPGYRVGLIGPVFRQSKMIFAEVEKLYAKSSILREACEKKPTRGSDAAYLRFKFVGGMTGSYIEALPLGDGGKIRGSRFYLICVDELAQVPDKILDMVVRPMGATTLEPMENVRKIERQRRLIELGLATEDDFEEDTVNKMIMASSGYYKFNHMWRRMRDYWKQMGIDGDEKSKYAVHQIPHWDLPEGFLDTDNIDEARRVMSNMEFRMEYEAHMASESEGFFKASLLEACTLDSGFSIEARGQSGAQYIVGVDPNQAGRTSSCGICIVKLGTINKLINVLELKKKTTQDMTSAVQEICKTYNVLRIFMDKGGGGKAVCDLLEDGYGGYEPIIDRTNKDHEQLQGRHILEMVNFNPGFISDANFTTLALLEDKKLRFPEPPTSTLDLDAVIYERIKNLKSQLLNIIVTQTSSGLLHFDTPKKGQKKDLYSALILASHGVRMFEKEMNPEPEPILFTSGLVRKHEPGAQFTPLTTGNVAKQGLISMAVLVKNKK